MFEQAGCAGQLCVQSLDGTREVAVAADRPAVSASVFKVGVALEAETQFAAGRLDPRERVTLPAANRTPGNIGFSLFRDDVDVSLQDLVVAMLTISDNHATDALLDRIGIAAVNAGSVRLGLAGTVAAADLRTFINSIGHAAGFADWDAMWAWAARPHPVDEEEATVRRMMAAAFPPPARVSAKSGSLVGVIRNEIGVIEYPDDRGYAAAVFARAYRPWQNDAAINVAIGTAAAAAVAMLHD